MKYFKYLLIGIIQGLTEPLPISSSAHMVFINSYLNLEPMSLSFECFVNFASTLAIFIFFYKDIKILIINTFTKDNSSYLNKEYTYKLIIASLPVMLCGLVFSNLIDSVLLTPVSCSIALIITGVMLLFGVILLKNQKLSTNELYTPKSYFTIGLSQAVALIPGLSRSGLTLITSLSCENNIKSSLKFSFFLYLIASIGAFILSLFKIDYNSINISYLLISCLGAFTATLLSLKWFYNKLGRKMLFFFMLYSFTMGTVNLIISLI